MGCVTKAGEVFTWGEGRYGRLLLGHGDNNNQYTPKRIEALVGVVVKQVAFGKYHTAICTDDGIVYTFGNGENGQLGHGDLDNKMTHSSASTSLEWQTRCTSAMWLYAHNGFDIKWICVHMGTSKVF